MSDRTLDRFKGCLMGLALGDALGAPHEGGPLERLVWRVIGRTREGALRWTDDTQMALDLAECLLASPERDTLDLDDLARRFAASYHWSRGYGPGAARVLRRIRRGMPWQAATRSVYLQGSWGNGAAMRAPVLALRVGLQPARLAELARDSALPTHAHPDGVAGAELMAHATQQVLHDADIATLPDVLIAGCTSPALAARLSVLADWQQQGLRPPPREVARQLGNGITAVTACPAALHIALTHLDTSFEDMMSFIIRLGGDVDTVGAMAGALWGAANGMAGLPQTPLEARDRLLDTAARLYAMSQ